jgi:hypothetical protein
MRILRRFGFASAFLPLLSACGSAATSAPAPAPDPSEGATLNAPAAEETGSFDEKTLGQLQMRNQQVTLFASRDGLRVTVRDQDGKILADHADAESLRATQPELYSLCRAAVASRSSYLDASLYRPRSRDARDARDGVDAFGARR